MIKDIHSIFGGVLVSKSSAPYINMSNPSAGMLRYNGNNVEVYDGYNWLPFAVDATVDLSPSTRSVLEWANEKMEQEERLKQLKDHPAIADLLKQKDDIEQKLKVLEILLRENNGSTSN